MTGTLRTIECKDWKDEPITYYEEEVIEARSEW
jgi:hypothetical protein